MQGIMDVIDDPEKVSGLLFYGGILVFFVGALVLDRFLSKREGV